MFNWFGHETLLPAIHHPGFLNSWSLGPLECLGVLSSPPVGQEGETGLPRHPAIRQHLFD